MDESKKNIAKETLKAMGVKPLDLIESSELHHDIKILLKIRPDHNPVVEIEVLSYEFVGSDSDKPDKGGFSFQEAIDYMDAFSSWLADIYGWRDPSCDGIDPLIYNRMVGIVPDTHLDWTVKLKKIETERYIGFKSTNRRYDLLLAERDGGKTIVISLNSDFDKYIIDGNTTINYWMSNHEFSSLRYYVYTTPEANEDYLKFLNKYEIDGDLFFSKNTPINTVNIVANDINDININEDEISFIKTLPEQFFKELETGNFASVIQPDSRFSYMIQYTVPTEVAKDLLIQIIRCLYARYKSQYSELNDVEF